MKLGIDAISKAGTYGMPVLHMRALQAVAAANNTVIGIRPVSVYASSYIANGHPTKPFAVKNKSAKTGAAAGLIVMNPLYSHIPNSEYEKHNKQLSDAFEKDRDLFSVGLRLSEERLLELKAYFGDGIRIQSHSDGNISINWNKDGEAIRVTGVKLPAGQGYYMLDEDGYPLMVLAKRVTDKVGKEQFFPMTADYDLLVVCPTYKDFQPGSLDRTPLRTQGSASNIFKSIQKSQSEEYQGPKEDALGGNWCDRTKKIAKQINDAIAEYDERRQGTNLQTVHHNNEFHNPFADELQNNMPCLVILPNEIDLGSISPDAGRSAIILIEKPEELIACRELLRKTGYYWPSHARYAAHPEFRLTRAISDGTLFSTTTPPAHLEVSKNVASLTSSSSPVFPRAQIRQL